MKKYIITTASALLSISAVAAPLPEIKTTGLQPGDKIDITDIGAKRSGDNAHSTSKAISADGNIIVGDYRTDSDYGLPHAFYYNVADGKMTDIENFRTDTVVISHALAISTDGQVITGTVEGDDGDSRAFRWRSGDTELTELGTSRADNSGKSYARATSADGRVVVGEAQSDLDGFYGQAFRHNEGDAKITNLGTLRDDNSGNSNATLVSADGRVVAGYSHEKASNSTLIQAFRHNEGDARMTALGTLRADNTENSWALAMSADGRIIVGSASTDNMDIQAFRHVEGNAKMTGLGTLRNDNSGNSTARAITPDGRVIVGNAATDNNASQAFRLNAGDAKMTGLGSLRADNTGNSSALAVSGDGRIVVGSSETDLDSIREQAFIHYENTGKMVNLGTLRSDKLGRSEANIISEDGRVIAGFAETDDKTTHAVLWKLKKEDIIDPVIKIIDKDKSKKTLLKTGQTAFNALDLYQSALYSLSDSRCQIGDSNYCVGAFTQFDNVSSNHRTATGLFGSFRLPAENWITGVSMNFANNTHLVDGYDTRGSNNPGVGAFIRYQENKNNAGFSAEISGAFLNQDITIQREKLANTEAGRGDSSIDAFRFKFTTSYGINISDETLLTPVAAISYHDVTRKGYTENRNAEFPATYGRMGNKSTDLQLGLDAQHILTQYVTLSGGAGADINLDNKRDEFTGRIDYIGAYAFDNGDSQDVKPYAYAAVNINMTPNSTVRANIGWHQTDYSNDAAQVGLSYSYHW